MQYDENAEKYGYEGEMTPIECAELQAYKGDVTIPVYGTIADAQVYLKKEADKVIAEKDKEIARLNDKALQYKVLDKEHCRDLNTQERFFAKQIAHHKYKRCLAMASRCRLRGRLLGACGLYEKELWALKWHKRWLEIADKFKEAK